MRESPERPLYKPKTGEQEPEPGAAQPWDTERTSWEGDTMGDEGIAFCPQTFTLSLTL